VEADAGEEAGQPACKRGAGINLDVTLSFEECIG
jgi:hypothetical protein